MRVKTPGAVTFTMNGLFEEPFSDPPGGIVDYVDGMPDIEAGFCGRSGIRTAALRKIPCA